MIALPPVQLDGSPLDGSTVNATLAEAAQSGALVGILTGGASYTLLDDAGGLFFLDGDQLRRSESGVLSDVDQPSVTLTFQVDDGAGNLSTVSAVIAVSASVSHDVVPGTAGNDELFTDSGRQYFTPGAGDDTIEADSSDVIVLSGARSDYEIVVTPGVIDDGYGGGPAVPTTITLHDLRAGGPDGDDLILTPSSVSFVFADGDYSMDQLEATGETGLELDGRVLEQSKYLAEDIAVGTELGQLSLRGLNGALPVITTFEVLAFSDSRPLAIDLTGTRSPFEVTESGMLRVIKPLDFENFQSYGLRVFYEDANGNQGFQVLRLTMLDVEDAPVLASAPGLNQAFRLTDFTDTTTDVQLGTLTTSDDDGTTGTISFLLGGADADKFFVQDGKLFLKAGTVLKTGSAFDFDLTVTPVDSSLPAGASATVDLDIGVRVPNLLDAIGGDYVAPSAIKVYIAPGGFTVTEASTFFSDPAPYASLDWTTGQVALIQAAFGIFASVANLTFTFVNSLAEADFAMLAAADSFPGSSAYWAVGGGTLTVGTETGTLDGWGHFGMNNFTASGFAPGSFGFYALIHEIAHGLGMNHPHDTGGGSVVMEGVTSEFNSYGAFDLNQAIYTVLSYNTGWETGPMGGPISSASGAAGSLGALDIAVLQAVYGANTATHAGDDTYELTDVSDGYSAIWDAGGRDKIVYAGTADVVISLQEATLDYATTGGGIVSYVDGVQDGFTIAHGVVIEEARGGRGDDDITGNGADNVLAGGAGADSLDGGAGDDWLVGGRGADVIEGGAGIDRVSYAGSGLGVRVDLGTGTGTRGQATGDVLSGVENVTGSGFADRITGDGGANQLVGGEGDDTLTGAGGNDRLNGGAGADVFAFDLGFGIDRVADFGAGDRIGLTTALWDSLGAADVTGFLTDHAREVGTRVVIEFGSDVLRLEGVTLASLLPDSFVFL